jgi:hypothetical protein
VQDVEAYERRFRRAGLPLFIVGYSAREDVWTRASPLLALVFLGEVLGAVDLDWSLAANLGALAGGLAILTAAVAVSNRTRGRAALARPDDIGRLELAGFVLVPALLPLIFGGQYTSALVTAGLNLVLLAVLYGVIGYGLLFIIRWAARRLSEQLTTAAHLLARAVPLLMLFAVVLFLTTEVWQVFADMTAWRLTAAAGLLAAVGVVFLVVRIPREVRTLEAAVEVDPPAPPLDRRQRLNVGLVLFVSQLLQVVVVSAAVAAFFIAFGLVALTPELVTTWIGHRPTNVVDVLGVEISHELLRVSGAIAAFSGLYYAIAVLTDTAYRAEFVGELTEELRASFADRADYLRALSSRL